MGRTSESGLESRTALCLRPGQLGSAEWKLARSFERMATSDGAIGRLKKSDAQDQQFPDLHIAWPILRDRGDDRAAGEKFNEEGFKLHPDYLDCTSLWPPRAENGPHRGGMLHFQRAR